ncbi:MAG: GDP-fucose synthetase [Proteobacteria bacterium]|nr:MAG: GDP-fucose synthetase [Pseudomonadota bacterium]
MERDARIFVAGSERFVGAALVRRLAAAGHEKIVGFGDEMPDLRDAVEMDEFFATEKPDYVFLLGGLSGGIVRNQREPASLMLDNLRIETAVLPAAQRHGAKKLVYLAAACIYPRECEQPMRPSQLGASPVEPTSEAYAMAKWAGLVLCRAFAQEHGARFVTAIPANPFGPGDDTRSEDAHVVGALLRRMHDAKLAGDAEVVVWGTGRARRDFLFVDDLADALVFVMERYEDAAAPINVSGGSDVSIGEVAERIQKVVGYPGRLVFDASRPDGAPRKTLDGAALAALGWRPRTTLDDALTATYRDFLAQEALRA